MKIMSLFLWLFCSVAFADVVTTSRETVIPVGSVSAPSLHSPTDPSTGIYFPAASQIGFTSNGTDRLKILGDGFILEHAGGDVIARIVNDATAGNDSYIYLGPAGNTDYHSIQADNDGAMIFRTQDATALTLNSGAGTPSTFTGTVRADNGTAGTPAYASDVDFDTGIWFPAASTAAVAIASSDEFRFVLNSLQVNGNSIVIDPGAGANPSTGDTLLYLTARGGGSNDSFVYFGDDASVNVGQISYDHSLNEMAFRAAGAANGLIIDGTLVRTPDVLRPEAGINNYSGVVTINASANSGTLITIPSVVQTQWNCVATFSSGSNSASVAAAIVNTRSDGTITLAYNYIQNGLNWVRSGNNLSIDNQNGAATSVAYSCLKLK